MNTESRQNETTGSLDDRVLALENTLLNRWERWFDRNPGVVIGCVIVALVSAFWMYHTWQIERIDKKHQEESALISQEHSSRVQWLKEQNELTSKSQENKYSYEISRLKSELNNCLGQTDKNITNE